MVSDNQKYSQYKYRTNTKGIEFRLSKKSFKRIINKECYYCGVEKAGGIDRHNNLRGYYHGNIVPCCWTCNRAKSDMDPADFEDYLARIRGGESRYIKTEQDVQNGNIKKPCVSEMLSFYNRYKGMC
jgi:hypothetical protein